MEDGGAGGEGDVAMATRRRPRAARGGHNPLAPRSAPFATGILSRFGGSLTTFLVNRVALLIYKLSPQCKVVFGPFARDFRVFGQGEYWTHKVILRCQATFIVQITLGDLEEWHSITSQSLSPRKYGEEVPLMLIDPSCHRRRGQRDLHYCILRGVLNYACNDWEMDRTLGLDTVLGRSSR